MNPVEAVVTAGFGPNANVVVPKDGVPNGRAPVALGATVVAEADELGVANPNAGAITGALVFGVPKLKAELVLLG